MVRRSATFARVRTISQRELRNDNAEIMRSVEGGETYTVTRRGVPVARLVPISGDSDLRQARPARRRPVFATLPRVTSGLASERIINELRGEQ